MNNYKLYYSKYRSSLWKKMKKIGFIYKNLKGWFDPSGHATGIFWDNDKNRFYTIHQLR
jgi:hypothetical protein